MPQRNPTLPVKPPHLRNAYAKPPSSRAYGIQGVSGPLPPPPRTQGRGGNVGDGQDESGETEGAPVEAADEQKQDDQKEKDTQEKDDAEKDNQGDRPQSPEGIVDGPPPPQSDGRPPRRKRPSKHPQKDISKLWKNFNPDYLGKVTRILPDSTAGSSAAAASKIHYSQNAAESYRDARAACEETVRKIVRECTALNQKYTDVHFDLESDLKITRKRNCIDGLVQVEADRDDPSDVKRVTDLFDNPKFFSDGAAFDDIIQGAIGDCWMMSAFSVLSSSEELIKRICVAQNQDIGVYGFVFFRDGEWHPTIIDDKLYLRSLAFDEGIETMLSHWGKQQEQKYNELFQCGSKALYFASCRDDNETWVPLLEKAFAKAHGGYDALRGGQTGECIEDLTGGVTTELYTTNILSKEKFWKNELRRINKDFMFDATDAMYREWQYWDEDQAWVKQIRNKHRKGLQSRHAYAVLDTYEGYGQKLVKIRNPWGEAEWDGAWSDGSPQWTSQWLERLDHKFGDDGVFWMSYKDFLNQYKHINRTRIFDQSWYTAQKWATLQVPFSPIDYQKTKFQIEIPESTDTVVVLSQLDTRYFSGLEGKYMFQLQFRISKSEDESDYIARSRPAYELQRSTNLELFLEKGTYTILVKVEATDWSPWGRKSPEEVIRDNLPDRKEKVTTIGRLYDLAHQKGRREDDEPALEPTSALMPPATAADIVSAEVKSPSPSPASATDRPVPRGRRDQDHYPHHESDSDNDDDSDSDSHSTCSSRRSSSPSRKSPWNASVVVGLRVYSKRPDVSVKVLWPPKKARETKETTLPQLDLDAITRAPQDEALKATSPVVEEKKPSIVAGIAAVAGLTDDKEKETEKEKEKAAETTKDSGDKKPAEHEPNQGVMSRRPDGKAVLVDRRRRKEDEESTEEEEEEESSDD